MTWFIKSFFIFLRKKRLIIFLIIIGLLLLILFFLIEFIKREIHTNILDSWQNVFIGFIACDVTIISIFFGAFIPLLVGNVKDNIPLSYFNVIKLKFFNEIKFTVVAYMLIIHIMQLIFCIFQVYYQPIIIIFVIFTIIYYLFIFFNGYQIFTKFNYAIYYLKQIDKFLNMIKKDILKNKLSKRKINKYKKKIDFIISSFPEKEIHFQEIGNFKVILGIKLYFFVINIFSNGLFLYERFHFF